MFAFEQIECVLQVAARLDDRDVLRHDVGDDGEPVDLEAVLFAHETERRVLVVDDDSHAVSTLAEQGEDVGDRSGGGDRHRRLVDRVARLDVPDRFLDGCDRNVLR